MTRTRRPILLAFAVGVASLALVAAGCGGGGSHQSEGAGSSSTTPATTNSQNARLAAALDLAHCMRAHGVPDWPDPDSAGGFDKAKLTQLPVSPSRIRAIEDRSCNISIPSGNSAQPITAADRADYLRAAACMRSDGFPDFPDPTFPGNTVTVAVPSAINQDSAAYRAAAGRCTRLIPAGLPYSRRDNSETAGGG